MECTVHEYDPSDTPSGFLRWSRPARREPLRVRKVLEDLRAKTRSPMRYMMLWAVLSGIPLALCLWYLWTLLTITYRLPSVVGISLEKIALDRRVWCGMVSLEPSMQYCARGTVDLRIRNDLWADITIVEAELALGYMFIDRKTKAHFVPEGFLTIDGTTVKAMSERVYILPVHLQWTTFEEYSISSFSFSDIDIELRALGYRFRTLLKMVCAARVHPRPSEPEMFIKHASMATQPNIPLHHVPLACPPVYIVRLHLCELTEAFLKLEFVLARALRCSILQ